MDTQKIKLHTPVTDSEGTALGLAQRIYRGKGGEGVAIRPYEDYLKLFDFESGDSLFIPLEFVTIDEQTGDVQLSITQKRVLRESFSSMPRTIAYGLFEKEELGQG